MSSEKRESGSQILGFATRPFVLCGLPVRRPPQSHLIYERRNGFFTLQITGHPEFGLPFGQDRLVPIFLSTLAVRQQSQTIRFQSAAQMLDTFGMAKGGKEYRRLVAAFERIFGATIFFGTDSVRGGARVVHRCRFNFLREARIWYQRDPLEHQGGERFENVIVLSDEFYTRSWPIRPTDMEAVKVLASAVLDLFMWLVYRCFTCQTRRTNPAVWRLRIDRPVAVRRIHEATPTIRCFNNGIYDTRRLAGVSRQDLRGWTPPLAGAGKSHSATNRNSSPFSRRLPCFCMIGSRFRL